MSDATNLKEEFKLVTYKKKNFVKPVPSKQYAAPSEDYSKGCAIRRIKEAKEDILSSNLYSSILASLRESLLLLNNPKITEIVCFGLGKIGECMTSRYQLALLLCFKDLFDVKVCTYDPIFTVNDVLVLEDLGCEVLTENLEGKYDVKENDITLFYMPHCAKQLSNNLLWANWGLQLNNCIIIANSFTKIIESHTKTVINECADFIRNISPYVVELAIINTFKYFDIFNETAIHVFPFDKLSLISSDFWNYRDEPKYSADDVEFITGQLQNKLTL